MSKKKNKIWSLHQFFHFLTLKKVIPQHIALTFQYPRVGKKEPTFLTMDEFNQILKHIAIKENEQTGLTNLIIVMLMGILGLRVKSITLLDVDDVNLANQTILVIEKGNIDKRVMPMPNVLAAYLTVVTSTHGTPWRCRCFIHATIPATRAAQGIQENAPLRIPEFAQHAAIDATEICLRIRLDQIRWIPRTRIASALIAPFVANV
ncbi:tyrosine-type recombinase/integrase [candidate division KSB1 bacterium]|nr:tyrosine-type recombinase/integrase [candidate division KSB1 bacterium]